MCELAAQGRDDTGFNKDSGPGLCKSDSWVEVCLESKTGTSSSSESGKVAMGNRNAPGLLNKQKTVVEGLGVVVGTCNHSTWKAEAGG